MKITSALLSLSLLLFSCSHNNETEALFLKADSLMDEYPDSVLQLLNIQPEEILTFFSNVFPSVFPSEIPGVIFL